MACGVEGVSVLGRWVAERGDKERATEHAFASCTLLSETGWEV